MRRRNDAIWRNLNENADDDTPSWVRPIQPSQNNFSRGTARAQPVNVKPARTHRSYSIHPDGHHEATEEYTESTIPIAQRQMDLQEKQQENDYLLGVRQMDYEFKDKQEERQHEETLKEIDQRPAEAELRLQEQQQKFEQEKARAAYRAQVARETRIFQGNLMKNGMEVIKYRQDLFELFGFPRAAATNIDTPRLSDPTVLLSKVSNNDSYIHSLLATGVDTIDENPFNCHVRFHDGTRMNLPNGRHGYLCFFRRIASGFYIIHVHRHSTATVRNKYRTQYLQSLICCNNQCNVH